MASKSLSKSDIVKVISEAVTVPKSTVKAILDALPAIVVEALKTSGEFTIPNLVKLKAKSTPATADRPGVNPFTKQPTTIKGKPASLKVRATPVKMLKEAVAK